MRLKVLGSSSSGNSYILEASNEVLIIEAGVKLREIKRTQGFRIDNIAGCLVSHQHNDHAGYIREYIDNGINVLSSESVASSKGITGHDNRFKLVYPQHGYKLKSFKIIPFDVVHDVPCLGFVITHKESGTILFLTDTFWCDYTFPRLNQIMIECNFADDIVENNIINGRLPGIMRQRLLLSHFELEKCKQYLRSLDLSAVTNIVLLHLSDGNSDEARFVREIAEEFGINTAAASKKNVTNIEFNLNPY